MSDTSPELIAGTPIAGQPWTLQLRGVEKAVSIIIEFYGANGGIFRIFPRGRSEMRVNLVPKDSGDMSVIATCRDDALGTIGFLAAAVRVEPASEAANVTASQPRALTAQPLRETSLGPQKPPYMLPHDTFAAEQPRAQAQPHNPAVQPSSTIGAASPSDIARDMQERTNALLDRLKKR